MPANFVTPPLFRNISKQGGDGYLDVYGRTLDFLSVKQGNSDRVVYGPPPALGEGWLEGGADQKYIALTF